jgi:hypothetical protein
MGPFQIAFIAMNLILPAWLYFSSDSLGVKWDAWEQNMARLIDLSGGANCPTESIVEKIRDLCKKSGRKASKKETVIMEQDIGRNTYSCEWRRETMVVKISHAAEENVSSECVLTDTRSALASQPAFVFTAKGFVNSMTFDGNNGERQAISIRNCRRKLKLLKSNASSSEELEAEMPAAPNDPPDVKTANRLCWVFDAAAGWNAIRQRYPGKSE